MDTSIGSYGIGSHLPGRLMIVTVADTVVAGVSGGRSGLVRGRLASEP